MTVRALVTGCLAVGAGMVSPSVAMAGIGPAPAPVTNSPASSFPASGVPPAHRPFVAVGPRTVAAGENLLVSVGCEPKLFHEVRSAALDIGRFSPITSGIPPISQAVGTVKKDLRPGYYSITVLCDKTTLTANFTVAKAKATRAPVTSADPSPAPTKKPVAAQGQHQVKKVPTGAPQTGGGGAAR